MHIRFALLTAALGAAAAWGQITAVNGASYAPGQPVSPGSFATIFGQGLCAQTAAGSWIALGKLPLTLGGCSVEVAGVPAMLSFVSPTQINFIVPEDAGTGRAVLSVRNGSGVITGSVVIGRSGPGIFSLNGLGMGEGAVLHGKSWQRGPFSVTTDGQPTPVTIFVTGLDLATAPTVTIGGVPAEVLFYGNAPGFAGLQQINAMLPPSLAGAGRVPVVVTSGGSASNVTYITLLPTSQMMAGMPGWTPGREVGENARRGREASFLALNAANQTLLITDEEDDSVRVISLATGSTVATIALPDDSAPRHVVVNPAGTLAVVALEEKAAVALIDLGTNKVASILPAGMQPGHLAFAGTNLLVSCGGSAWVAVIDTVAGAVTRTVPVGYGAAGIAAAGNLAVVANMQEGSLSLIDLTAWTVAKLALPEGVRPWQVAIAGSKAVVTAPLENAFFVVDLATRQVTKVNAAEGAKGPGAVAAHNALVFIANQLSASVSVFDTAAGGVVRTFPVDPGPRALVVDAARNQLLVLCQGAGTVVVVDLAGYTIVKRLDAGETVKEGRWALPVVASMAPKEAAVGGTAPILIKGANLQGVEALEFLVAAGNPGQGQGQGRLREDPDIKVTGLKVNEAGTELTAAIAVAGTAAPGVRQVRLRTEKAAVAAGAFTIVAR